MVAAEDIGGNINNKSLPLSTGSAFAMEILGKSSKNLSVREFFSPMNLSLISRKSFLVYILLSSFLLPVRHLHSEVQRMDGKTALKMLDSSDPEIRKSAVISLVNKGGSIPDSALEPILRIAMDEDVWSRAWAVAALEKMGPKVLERTQSVFLTALGQEPEVARNAASAVGKFKLKAAVTPLEKLLEDEKGGLNHFAAESLSRIGGEEAKSAYLRYVNGSLPILLEKLDSQRLAVAVDADEFISKMADGMTRLYLQDSPEWVLVSTAQTKAKQKMKERWSRE